MTNEIKSIKEGQFVMVNSFGEWVKRKVLFIQKDYAGNECYIVKVHNYNTKLYINDIKLP